MKKIISLILMFIVSAAFSFSALAAEEPLDIINSIIEYKGSGSTKNIIDDDLIDNIGVNVYDWYAFCAGRIGGNEDYARYISGVQQYISNNENTLNTVDYERLALACASCGDDISVSGLLDAAVLDSFDSDALSDRIVNHLIFALLALDSNFYEIPNTANISRQALITEIMSRQMDCGALYMMNSKTPETDLTAMMITAFTPYINSSTEFTFVNADGEERTSTVRESVDKALDYLSGMQNDDGTMNNWGKPSCETTAQTLVALCTLGIDIDNDERFIKNGSTLLDGLMSYQLENGGFAHSFEGLGNADGYATTQAMYALTAYVRGNYGYRNLFDMRAEQDNDMYLQIKAMTDSIDKLDTADVSQAKILLDKYTEIPLYERMYVKNFSKLADVLHDNGIENTADYAPDELYMNVHGSGLYCDVTQERVLYSEDTLDSVNDNISILESSIPQNSGGASMSIVQITALICVGIIAVCVIIINHTLLKRKHK